MIDPQRPGEVFTHVPQMTLRDWFAGQAMSGLLATLKVRTPEHIDAAAQVSYALADAMVAERRKEAPDVPDQV